jgi:hypothetical protein
MTPTPKRCAASASIWTRSSGTPSRPFAQQRGAPARRALFGIPADTEIAPRGRKQARSLPGDTGTLTLIAICDGTRAARLLTELGVQPAAVRQRLEAAAASPPDPRKPAA